MPPSCRILALLVLLMGLYLNASAVGPINREIIQRDIQEDSVQLVILKQLASTSKVDSVKWNALTQIFDLLKSTKPEDALVYIQQAEDLAVSTANNVWLIETMRMHAYVLDELGQRREALNILTSAINLSKTIENKEINEKLKTLYNNAGVVYMLLGIYDSALTYHMKSLELKTKEGEIRQMANSHVNIGLTYFRLGNYQQAISHYQNAIDLKRMIKDESGLLSIYNKIGFSYIDLGQPRKAIVIFEEGIKNCKDCGSYLQAEMLYGLGFALGDLSDPNDPRSFNSGFEPLSKSLALAESIDDPFYTILSCTAIGNLYLKFKDPVHALEYAKRAYDIVPTYNDNALKLASIDLMARAEEGNSNYKASAKYFQMYIDLKDSVFNKSLIKNVSTIEAENQQRDNMNLIRLTQDSLDEKSQQLFLSTGVVVVLVLLILTLIYVSVKLRSMTKNLEGHVASRTAELKISNQSLKLVNHELNTFLYRASHDIKGPLATLQGLTSLSQTESNPSMIKGYLAGIQATADKLNVFLDKLVSLHDVMQHTPVPETISLHTMIGKLGFELNGANQIHLQIDSIAGVTLTSDRTLLATIFRTLISNAIKYRNTQFDGAFLRFSVKTEKDFINVILMDNGLGFGTAADTDVMNTPLTRASESSANGGLGLYIAQVAAGKLQGTVSLLSTNKTGSTFKVRLPIMI